ncbi:MAG: type II toxin-antitoxin system Y4mF family antitoxin [Arachnia sp.]
MEELGKQLKTRRRDLGLTQIELAELAGVSDRFVRSMEHGKSSLQFDSFKKVLDALGMELQARVRR